jgi:hypothetical protein
LLYRKEDSIEYFVNLTGFLFCDEGWHFQGVKVGRNFLRKDVAFATNIWLFPFKVRVEWGFYGKPAAILFSPL